MKFFFFEIGHIGNQNIENFMLISKMQTYRSDKMPPKKVIIEKRKKWDLAKLKNSFLIITFWGGGAFLSLRQVCFFEISIKFPNFLTPYMTYFKKKKFHISEGPILKFSNTKTEKR